MCKDNLGEKMLQLHLSELGKNGFCMQFRETELSADIGRVYYDTTYYEKFCNAIKART